MLKSFFYFMLRTVSLTILYTTLALAAISAGVFLLVAYDPGDGWCYWEWRKLSKEEFCRMANDGLPTEKPCVVEFGRSNVLYASVYVRRSDPSICKNSSCIATFDSCGNKVRI
jgi:hypothetical protein